MVYAVIDTIVLVSAIIAAHTDSATVIIREKIMDGTIVPLYNAEIFDEYRDVLTRPKFQFPEELVDAVLDVIIQKGLSLERTKTEEVFSQPRPLSLRPQNCSEFLMRWNKAIKVQRKDY